MTRSDSFDFLHLNIQRLLVGIIITLSDVIFNGPFVSTGTPDAGSVDRATKGQRPKIASVGRTAEKRMHA